MEKSYYLYLTTCHTQESHALCVKSNPDLAVIKESLIYLIKAMFHDGEYWWYHEDYAEEKAEEFTKPFVGKLEDGSEIMKRKYSFFGLGFIITNFPMWPDNKGGYEHEFYI